MGCENGHNADVMLCAVCDEYRRVGADRIESMLRAERDAARADAARLRAAASQLLVAYVGCSSPVFADLRDAVEAKP